MTDSEFKWHCYDAAQSAAAAKHYTCAAEERPMFEAGVCAVRAQQAWFNAVRALLMALLGACLCLACAPRPWAPGPQSAPALQAANASGREDLTADYVADACEHATAYRARAQHRPVQTALGPVWCY